MQGTRHHPTTVEEYIAQFPVEVQQILMRIRAVIREVAPEATEKISYSMLGYYWGKNGLVWIGAFKRHIGLYPWSAGMTASLPELAAYKGTKGSVHLPLDRPIPDDLIRRIVKVRLAEVCSG